MFITHLIYALFIGLVSTFILGWFAGVLIAGIHNLCLRMGN